LQTASKDPVSSFCSIPQVNTQAFQGRQLHIRMPARRMQAVDGAAKALGSRNGKHTMGRFTAIISVNSWTLALLLYVFWLQPKTFSKFALAPISTDVMNPRTIAVGSLCQ
jgi:hypothetical protein